MKCGTSHGTSQYYINGKYVPKSDKRIQSLVDRDYYAKFADIAQSHLEAVEKLLQVRKSFPLNCASGYFCKGKQAKIVPLYEDDDTYASRWQAEEFDRWIPDPDTKNLFETNRGEIVKSKSEKMIADELFRLGIPYHYEYPLTLNDHGRTVIKRPDFVILNKRTRRVYITEHLGMMGNETYIDRNIKKWTLYEENGYLLGVNLLLFHETVDTPINMKVFRAYVNTYFL